MFRKQSDICFFCNNPVPTVSKGSRKGFRCPHCECWNSDEPEPAMRVESLNTQSFSKRTSPNKDRIPSNFSSKSVFCHTCETNQHLVLHLLSNYLPPPTDPEYEQRLQMLPQYTESLHQRYPQVCDSCLPLVEDEIRRKDDMARSQALGGWLKQTKGKAKQRRVSATLQEREALSKALIIWRIRGCFWGITLLLHIVGYAAVLFDQRPFRRLSLIQPALPAFMLLSVLWTAWDPTYASMRTAQIQGRDVQVQGKRQYIVLQMILWFSRLATATLLALQWFHVDYLHISQRPLNSMSKLYFLFSLLLETSVSIASISILRLQRPPTIRLINTRTDDLGRSRSSTPNPANDSRAGTPFPPGKLTEPDLFASLSLSSQPIVPKNAPIFGVPSLSVPSSRTPEATDKDEMDWSPTSTNPNPNGAFSANSSKRFKSPADDDGSWLRPQRFFAPEKPTGLESLFENTKLIDDVPMQDGTKSSISPSKGRSSASEWQSVIKHIEIWWWVYIAVLVLLLGMLLKFWIGRAPIALHQLSYDDGAGDPIQQSGVYRHTSRSNVIPQ